MKDIRDIAKIIEKNGGKLYLVGGSIRDSFMKKKSHDEDYCVTGLTSIEFINLFPNIKIRGKSFEVYDLDGKEFALARIEKKSGIGHKDFQITTGKNISIYDDLKRRDITINSIAQDVITQEIIDPFNGVQDIKNKKIRATSDAFSEDPLRVYRVARFAAQLDYEVTEDTISKMSTLKKELVSISKERIFEELKKALESDKPSKFFITLNRANVLDVHFKEISNLIGCLQPEEHHPEGDAFNHTMISVDNAAKLTNRDEVRFATLVHDLGKALTPKKLYPHHYGHDEKGEPLVEIFGNRVGVPHTWIKCGKVAAKYHMKGGIFEKMTAAKQINFIDYVYKSQLGLDGMKVVVLSDKNRLGKNEKVVNFDKIGEQCIKQINGEFIKKKYKDIEEKNFGEKLREERIKFLKNITENELFR